MAGLTVVMCSPSFVSKIPKYGLYRSKEMLTVVAMDLLTRQPADQLSAPHGVPEACDFTVFGGTGDLALRKLLPALYLRDLEGQLPDDTRIVGVSRAELDDDGYRAEVRAALTSYVAPDDLHDSAVARLLERLHHVTLDIEHADDWHLLHGLLKDRPGPDDA